MMMSLTVIGMIAKMMIAMIVMITNSIIIIIILIKQFSLFLNLITMNLLVD